HLVGQVFPGAGDAPDMGLVAEVALRADFASHAGHFRGEGTELVHHGVDGVLEFEDFAFDIDGNLLGEIAVSHGRGDLGNIAHLGGEVAGHEVHAVGQVFPGAGDAPDIRLAAQASLRAHFAGHAGDFRGEGTELVHHRVDGVLELEDFPLDGDRDCLRGIAVRYGGRDLGA